MRITKKAIAQGKNKDEVLFEKLRNLRFEFIKKNISGNNPTFEYELEFIRRITLLEKCDISLEARKYFLEDYSVSFLKYIASSLFQCDWKAIWGEYCEFISQENFETKVPYYKLTLYKGKNDSNLKTYTSIITTRYFVNRKKKDDDVNMVSIDEGQTVENNGIDGEVIENPWFGILVDDREESNWDMDIRLEVNKALKKLPEREQLIIKLMVMDDASGLEAFEDLAPYLNPSKMPLYRWSDKQKQDAMSLLKGRALKHLKQIIQMIYNKQLI